MCSNCNVCNLISYVFIEVVLNYSELQTCLLVVFISSSLLTLQPTEQLILAYLGQLPGMLEIIILYNFAYVD